MQEPRREVSEHSTAGAVAASASSEGGAGGLGLVYVAMSCHVLLSAGTYLAGKRAMVELAPLTVVLWRFVLSAVVYVGLLALSPGPRLPPRAEWGRVLVLGLLAGPINQLLFFYGLELSTAAHAGLLYALTPLGVYLVGLWRGQEQRSGRAVAGLLTALVGVVVVLMGRGLGEARGSLVGDGLILAAVVAWVAYTVEGRPFAREHGPVRATAWSLVAAALLMVPALPWGLEPQRALSASGWAQASVLYLALLTSVVAYLIWYYALSKAPASRVAIFSNLQPVATALAAWAILGEPLSWSLAAGGALVLVGVRLTQGAQGRMAAGRV